MAEETEETGNWIIGTREAADILGISQRHARRVLQAAEETGEIPIVHTSARGEVLVPREAVIQYKHTHE